MAHLLGAESLHLEYPTRVVFDGLTVGIEEGDRIGIVGRNGDGKSSLLSMLAGHLEPDAGRVTRRGGITLAMLRQSDTLDDTASVQAAILGDTPEYQWAGNPRIRDVLGGLVSDIPTDALIGELSGGQRRRVALARVLIGDWDMIFLDEPTNHLDIEGISWLADHLKRRWSSNSGALAVVTHDRWFLDEVCTATWEVHDRQVEPFEGGYAAYILQRVERDRMAAASESKRQNLMRKELAWLRRGAPARTAKPKFRMDAAWELIENEPPPRDTVSLSSMAMQRLGKDVVDLENVSVRYPGADSDVLNGITWHIAPGERTGILGVNGAGKSTLLGLIDGSVHPTAGRVKRGKTIKVATLTQQLGELEGVWNDRVSEVVGRLKSSYVAGGKEMTPTQLLERVGFSSAQLSTPVRDLSGGQQRRLQLLLILLSEPNVLILDEPTNDLDTDILAAIEDLLDSFAGTLLVVSHDRYLIERVTDQQYAVMDGGFRHLPRGVEQYLELRRAEEARESVASRPTSVAPTGLQGAELRNAEKELASVTRKMEKTAGRIAAVHARFATFDHSDYGGLAELSAELKTLEDSLHALESRWLELSQALEG